MPYYKRKPELIGAVPVSGSNVECRLKASTKIVYGNGNMKSKNIKTKDKKNSKAAVKKIAKKVGKAIASKPHATKIQKVEKTKKVQKIKGENKNKKFFPKDAKVSNQKKSTKPRKIPMKPAPTKVEVSLPDKAPAKRTPWARKPIENIHSTPANAGYSMRSEFDKYIAKKYKRLKDDQIKSLWITVSSQMLAEPNLKLLEVVDNCLTKK